MKRRTGFTVVEFLLSVVIGVATLGGVAAILVQLAGAWQDSLASWMLAHHGRIARERILRGIEATRGLREGDLRSLTIDNPGALTEALEFIDGGQRIRIEADASSRILQAGRMGSGGRTLVASGMVTERLEFRVEGRVVRCLLRLGVRLGGKTYTHDQEIACYVLNG